jgi:membrane associated rhomboid family serine protease
VSAVKALIAANVAIYLLQSLYPELFEALFALWPLTPIEGHRFFEPWQLITYAFLHDTHSIQHLLFNMLGLWMFGVEIERYVGSKRFLACYFASVLTAAISQLFVPGWLGSPAAPTVGASGGVFGLLLAYAMLFPQRKVVPLIPPIPMPAWVFASVYAAIELVLGLTGRFAGVAHFAHLGGMIGSVLVVRSWHLASRR